MPNSSSVRWWTERGLVAVVVLALCSCAEKPRLSRSTTSEGEAVSIVTQAAAPVESTQPAAVPAPAIVANAPAVESEPKPNLETKPKASEKPTRRLEATREVRTVEVFLGMTPRLDYLFWSGYGIVLARVELKPTSDADELSARIVTMARLWKDSRKSEYEYRDTPQVRHVPFTDENGNEWTLVDGSSWKLNEEFVITRGDLLKKVREVPSYKPDGRPWYARNGAKSALEAAEMAIKVLEIATPDRRK